MFRSGGPIKEGIMDGMKEPQAINTVGSPLAPQDASGRQKYAFQLLPFLGLAGGTAARTAAFEPQQRLQQFGAGLSGLAGFGGVAPQIPSGPDPLTAGISNAV